MRQEKNSKIKVFLKSINIYGIPFHLHYKKSSTYTSTIGIILSILSILFLSFLTLYHFIRLIKRTSFSVLTSYDNKSSHIIDLSNIPIMIGLLDSNSSLYEMTHKFYNITVFMKSLIPLNYSTASIYYRRIELESCNESIYVNQYPEMKLNYDLSKYLCIKPNQSIIINGRYGTSIDEYNSLNIYFMICTDSKCENVEFIDEANDILYNSFLSIHYIYDNIDHYNYKNPLSKIFRSINFQISPMVFKKFLYFFSNMSYITDEGIFFTSHKKYSSFIFDHLYLDFVGKYNNDTIMFIDGLEYSRLVQISFSCADYPIIYKRDYLEVTEIFSKIGGCIDFIFIFCNTITNYFSKKNLIVDITDNLIYKQNKNDPKYNYNYQINKISKFVKSNNLSKPLNDYTTKDCINNTEKKFIIDLNRKNLLSHSKNYICLNNNQLNISINNKNMNNQQNFVKTFKSNIFQDTKLQKFVNKNISNQYPQKLKISLIDYILPYFCLRKYKKYELLCAYTDIMNYYLSIEEYFPTMERISKLLKYDKDIISKTNADKIFSYINDDYEENNNIILSPNKNSKRSSLKKIIKKDED